MRLRSKDGSSDRVFILRVLHQEGSQTFGVEVASDDGTWADETMRVIVQNGITATIFRNHLLQVSFGVRIALSQATQIMMDYTSSSGKRIRSRGTT